MGAGTNCTSSTVYCYDANGNLLNDGFHRYDFNAENQILDVDNYNDQYTYDAHGNRVRKDVNGQPSTEYIYFGGQVVAEKNTWTEDWSDYIYANGKRMAKSTNFEDRILIQGDKLLGLRQPVHRLHHQWHFLAAVPDSQRR